MLLHSLDHQGIEEHVIRMAAEQGHAIPPELANAPELLPGLALYLDAFNDLRTCASENGPIPWTAIDAWARAMDLDARQTATLHHHVRALDRALLKWIEKKRKANDARAVRSRNKRAR